MYWLVRRKRSGKATLLDPTLFRSKLFTAGATGIFLQQVALGGMLIALPIYLQLVWGYNAFEAGITLAPLSLTMFGVAVLAGEAGRPAACEPSSSLLGSCCSPRRSRSSSHLFPGPTPAGTSRFR